MIKGETKPNPVLYVEDEEDDAFLVRLAFQRAAKATPLIVVRDGTEAVEYLSRNGDSAGGHEHSLPCLVLLDLNLPIMSGLEVLGWIRAQPALKELPVVIFSSSNHPKDKTRAQEMGASEYLVKPVNMGRMEDVIEQLLERWARKDTRAARGEFPAKSSEID